MLLLSLHIKSAFENKLSQDLVDFHIRLEILNKLPPSVLLGYVLAIAVSIVVFSLSIQPNLLILASVTLSCMKSRSSISSIPIAKAKQFFQSFFCPGYIFRNVVAKSLCYLRQLHHRSVHHRGRYSRTSASHVLASQTIYVVH